MDRLPFPSNPEDEVLLEGVARQVADVNRFFSKERVEREAAQGERQRLARELHDGVLQSLAGARLQLEALSRLIDKDPVAAQKRLQVIEELISDEQRELRTLLRDFKPVPPEAMASSGALAAALELLCRRVEKQWGLHVRLTVADRGAVQRTLGDDIYRIVQEALSNVAKHAAAELARVDVAILHDRVRIVVSDDGRGFPFHGRHDLAALNTQRRGPVSLKERVGALHGTLVLTSMPSGSMLEFTLPLHHDAFGVKRVASGS